MFLHQRETTVVAKVTPAENVEIPANCELVAADRLDGLIPYDIPATEEPINDDQGLGKVILVGKALITSAANVPVRLINVNDYPVTLKRGTQVGMFER